MVWNIQIPRLDLIQLSKLFMHDKLQIQMPWSTHIQYRKYELLNNY